MLIKIKNIFYITLTVFFLYFLFSIYISEKNKKTILSNRSKSSIEDLFISSKNLPILKNDTDNIIEYKKFSKEEQNKKKNLFWSLIKN